MKKFFVIVSIFVLSLPLFAIPKYDGTFFNNGVPEDLYNNKKAIQYINNSCQNLYALTVISDDSLYPYSIYFSNYSLVSKVEIILKISFSSEQELNEFSLKFVKSVNLEDAFLSVRQLFIDKWLKPNIVTPSIKTKNRDTLKTVEYNAFYCNLID